MIFLSPKPNPFALNPDLLSLQDLVSLCSLALDLLSLGDLASQHSTKKLNATGLPLSPHPRRRKRRGFAFYEARKS